MSNQPDTEWTDADNAAINLADYRELQAQHDALQTRCKLAMDWLRWAHTYVLYADSAAGFEMDNSEVIDAVRKLPELEAFLAQPAAEPMQAIPPVHYAVGLESVAMTLDRRAAQSGKPVPAVTDTDELRALAKNLRAVEAAKCRP